MSERIKIRAWDKTHNIMRYNYFGKSGDNEDDWVFFNPEFDDRGGVSWGGTSVPYERNQFILMLASNVREKPEDGIPGNIIYEGDLLQDWKGESFAVVFDGVRFYAHGETTDKELTSTSWKIAGTIFNSKKEIT